MPNISILEQDLTTAADSSVSDNAVYVPGYSIMGPANEPTLCTTLAEFKKTFGAVPYVFKKAQNIQGKKFTTAGDYEKSYIYAAELVKAGLPVLFERIVTSDTKASRTISLGISALVSEKLASNITRTADLIITEVVGEVIGEGEEQHSEYTCVVDIANILGSVTARALSDNITNIVYDNGTLSFNSTVSDITAENISQYICVIDTWSDTIYYKLRCEYKNDIFNAVVYSFADAITNDEIATNIIATVDYDKRTFSFIDEYNNNHNGILTVEDAANQSQLNIYAKYSGEYGKNITIKFVKNWIDGDLYYSVYVNQIAGLVEDNEVKMISFDESKEQYYFENVEFRLIDLEMPSFDYDYAAAKLNLVKIADAYENVDLKLEINTSNTDEFNIDAFYNKLYNADGKSVFTKLTDRDAYQIKFITAGGYPVYGINDNNAIMDTMLVTAANRGDCVALIDHLDPINNQLEIMFEDLKEALDRKLIADNGEDAKKYGAMFTPWGKYKLNIVSGTSAFPGSYAYLRCLANSSKTNANWFAIANVSRGQVPDLLGLNSKMTGAIAESFQTRKGIAINPITNIKPYGYCIWGNRTLFNNINDLTASSFLNIRVLSCDVKKVVYAAAKRLTFELNSDILWLNFKAAIEPTLDRMVSGNGLSNYKITKIATDKKATVACKIKLFAVDSVEDWDVTVELADGYTSVE